jgi:aspartyl-tRNA(Asn)/glutamyl-tRNA(Gln) amidotransferase subunit C
MAQIDDESIHNLFLLSRIECTKESEAALLKDLKQIIAYFEQLNEINTDNVMPCNQVLAEVNNVTREDVIGNIMPRDTFLSNVPSQIGGMVKVPTVIKQN